MTRDVDTRDAPPAWMIADLDRLRRAQRPPEDARAPIYIDEDDEDESPGTPPARKGTP